jgi:membrane-associated phospholipid phosphatase
VTYWKNISVILNQKKHFFLSFLFYLIIAILILLLIGNKEFSQLVNAFSSPILDKFFYFITYLGDGVFAALFIVFLFLLRLNLGFVSLFSILIPGLTTQVLKRFCFPSIPRPSVVFNNFIESENWHLIDGVDLHSYFSFPSGHTTTIFSICCLSIILIKNKFYHLPILFLGILTGFSRIHLSQHFLIDVFVGSIVGCLGTLLVYGAFKNLLVNSNWANFSLLKLIFKK